MPVPLAFSRNVGYIAGNNPGLDYLQFPIVTVDEWEEIIDDSGADDDRRIDLDDDTGCDILALIAFIWRVKTWKLTGTFGLTYTNGSPSGNPSDSGNPRAFSAALGNPGTPGSPSQFDGFLIKAKGALGFEATENVVPKFANEWQFCSYMNSRGYERTTDNEGDNLYVPWMGDDPNPLITKRFPSWMDKKFRYESQNFNSICTYWSDDTTAPGYGFYGAGTSVVTLGSTGFGGSFSDGAVCAAGANSPPGGDFGGQAPIEGVGGLNNNGEAGTGRFIVFDETTGLFYPHIACSMQIWQFVTLFLGTIRVANVDDTPNGTLTIDPVIAPSWKVPVFIEDYPLRAFGQLATSAGSVAFTMTAIEFWPYMNKAGDLCYDTANGNQLADPFLKDQPMD